MELEWTTIEAIAQWTGQDAPTDFSRQGRLLSCSFSFQPGHSAAPCSGVTPNRSLRGRTTHGRSREPPAGVTPMAITEETSPGRNFADTAESAESADQDWTPRPSTSVSVDPATPTRQRDGTRWAKRRDDPMTHSKLPTGRVDRTIRLAGLAGRTVATRAQSRLRNHASGDAAQAAELARQERLAERYAEVLGDMKGAVMKVGQILSFVDLDGVVPGPYRDLFRWTLARLQHEVPPLASEEIAEVIRAELGACPEEIFAFFSPKPVAAASIGQVHIARLADGTELAVKVQYPGVSEAVRADLANTKLLASVIRAGLALLGPQAPTLDTKVMVEEIRDRVADELDYRIEAANQQEFCAIYDEHPFIHIPAVTPSSRLAGSSLLTTYTESIGRRRRRPGDAIRSRWGETIFRFVFTSLHRYGIFNADPHPGNYLFHEDGTVTFLDFGCVKRFAQHRVEVMSSLVDAALPCDALRCSSLHQSGPAHRR